jgi:hypothetical protein
LRFEQEEYRPMPTYTVNLFCLPLFPWTEMDANFYHGITWLLCCIKETVSRQSVLNFQISNLTLCNMFLHVNAEWFCLWLYWRFEVFTAVSMKNGIFWNVTPCDSYKNRCFGGMYRLLHQGDKNWWTRNVGSNMQ